jgi:hypothetical protein
MSEWRLIGTTVMGISVSLKVGNMTIVVTFSFKRKTHTWSYFRIGSSVY